MQARKQWGQVGGFVAAALVGFSPVMGQSGTAEEAVRAETPARPLSGVRAQAPRAPAPPRAVAGRGLASQPAGRIQMTQSREDETVTVVVEGDRLTATINGRPVPEGRVRRDGERVEVLGEDGRPVATFVLTRPGVVAVAPRGRVAGVGGGALALSTTPPVMLGITMTEVPVPLAEHYGIKEGEGILINTVREGLPAVKAGVRASDIVVAADGQSPVTPDRLRELIRQKEPGQTLTLKVLRRGEEKDLEVELAEYRAEALVTVSPEGWSRIGEVPAIGEFHFSGDQPLSVFRDFYGARRDAAGAYRESLEKALEALREAGESEAVRDARRQVEEAVRQLREEAVELRRVVPEELAERLNQRLTVRDGRVHVAPRPEAPAPPEIRREVELLRAQVDELRAQRDMLQRELSEIKSLLRTLTEQRGG